MKLLSTGQMIDKLRIGDQAEYKHQDKMTDHHLIVTKNQFGAIVIVKNGPHKEAIGTELILNARVMSFKWLIIPKYVTFEEAIEAHKNGKTITFHHDTEADLTYTFVHELETGQFTQLANDSLCLYELIEGLWTIDN